MSLLASRTGVLVVPPNAPDRPGLGLFLGVFTPTVLTILGVIMYLRLGWVVGQAGLGGALLIVVVSNTITLLTALSLSSLATNMRVGVGGAYFMISRVLGLEVGGAIGIPLFLSQALSVTLYCYGLAEVLLSPWPNAPVPLVAGALLVGIAAVAARSTAWALRLQIPIMALIGASLVSLVSGVSWGPARVPWVGPWDQAGFWEVFAVFFPAVTGILAGVSLSGDLRDPGRAIPDGTLLAVAVGFVVYVTVPIALAHGADPEHLSDPLVWNDVAWIPWLIVPGMLGAITSSAFGSILGAPRTLQALANDRLAPRALATTDPQTGEPLPALRVSAAVALAAVALGDLNAVATVLTIFFLTTYGSLNLVAAIEALVGDPSFRPRLRVPWWASALGALGCVVAMFAISPAWAAGAILVELGIYWVLRRRSLEAAWGDVRGGMLLSGARTALLRLREIPLEPRSWRPHMLVFTPDLIERIDLVRIAVAFSQHRGIVTTVTLVRGDVEEIDRATALRRQEACLGEHGLVAFPEVIAVDDLQQGILTVAQANGFAGLDSNTILFDWHRDDAEALTGLLALTRRLDRLGKCTLIYRSGPPRTARTGDIVLWWKGREHNGDLMLLLAHLLIQDPEWRRARIVLKSVVDHAHERDPRASEFERMLAELRITAHVQVVVRPPHEDVTETIRRESLASEIVFVGLRVPDADREGEVAGQLVQMLHGVGDALLVRNGGPFRGRLL